MQTKKIIAVCLLAGASLVISKTSSAQISLNLASSTHLHSAVAVNTPSVRNAVRASTAATAATAGRVKTTGSAATRQIEGKTTTAIASAKSTKVEADVRTSASVH